MFVLITNFCVAQAMNENDMKAITKTSTLLVADVASYTAYSAQIGLSQIRGDRDREKRLQFCLWETQNFLTAIKKARTEEEMNAVVRQFTEQMNVCQKLISTI